jgi:hypothetical protein
LAAKASTSFGLGEYGLCLSIRQGKKSLLGDVDRNSKLRRRKKKEDIPFPLPFAF